MVFSHISRITLENGIMLIQPSLIVLKDRLANKTKMIPQLKNLFIKEVPPSCKQVPRDEVIIMEIVCILLYVGILSSFILTEPVHRLKYCKYIGLTSGTVSSEGYTKTGFSLSPG